MNNWRLYTAIPLLLISLLAPRMDFISGKSSSLNSILKIEKPPTEFIELSEKLPKIITDTKDQYAFAIYNNEFANRIDNYNSKKSQNVYNVYTEGARGVFGTSLSDNYSGLSTLIKMGFKEVVTEEDSLLTEDELTRLKNLTLSYAYILGN